MKFYNYNPPSEISECVSASMLKVIQEGQFIGGPQVMKFEELFGAYTGSNEVVTCGNGLDALSLCILDLNLPPESNIGVSGHTFFATWLAILNSGHIPIGIDADIQNLQMSTSSLKETLDRENLRAVIYVHMHGILGDIKSIAEICKSFSIPLIEDCAQAHGLKLETKHVGTFGDFGAFSFYPTKNLPALGDAGAIITSNKNLDLIRSKANYGWKIHDREKHETIGINSRMDTIQAAVLNVNLEYLDSFNLHRKRIAEMYIEVLEQSSQIHSLPIDTQSVWHHFPIRVERRREFSDFLESRQIPWKIHYATPCHLQPAYLKTLSSSSSSRSLQEVEEISKTILSLPLHPWMTDEEVQMVTHALRDWITLNES